ncbi:hypothetical protein [Vibrio sp. R78045]|uniref:hypothetical protein n=1 Tax=Vibrio sp. R78045 TaxID=3093868 RepID=UPI0036F269FD
MPNFLIKMTIDDDGEAIDVEDQKWCLSSPASNDAGRVLCTHAVLDIDTNAIWEDKTVVRGGITCEKCIAIVRAFKAVKL